MGSSLVVRHRQSPAAGPRRQEKKTREAVALVGWAGAFRMAVAAGSRGSFGRRGSPPPSFAVTGIGAAFAWTGTLSAGDHECSIGWFALAVAGAVAGPRRQSPRKRELSPASGHAGARIYLRSGGGVPAASKGRVPENSARAVPPTASPTYLGAAVVRLRGGDAPGR